MAAKKATSKNSDSALPFEEALAELQNIVGQLEDGELGLEDSMQQFEQGVSLLRTCYKTLEAAEQKIEILTATDADGNPQTADFDATATHSTTRKSAGKRKKAKVEEPSDDEDDSTLF